VCRAYVDAQNEFAARFHTYAQSLPSTPGQAGWPLLGGDRSRRPLGPLVASAATEGCRVREASEPPAPYHGYSFRILTTQGAHAPGGAKSHVKDRKMTGGFALVA